MTSHSASRDAGVDAAAAALIASTDALVSDVLTALVAEIPTYAQLPQEQLSGDVRRITHRALEAFARHVTDPARHGIEADHATAIVASAAQRAEEGIPMADIVRAYFVGIQVALSRLTESLGPELHHVLPALTARTFDYLQSVTAAVAEGYSRERELTLGEALAARLQLGSALVEGRDHDSLVEAARLAGIELPPAYTVLAVTVADDDVPDSARPRSDIVHARRVRQIRAHLLTRLGRDILWLPGYRDAMVLIPRVEPASAVTADDIRTAVDQLSPSVTAGIAHGSPDEVAGAARIALEVRDFVIRLGRAPGCHELADVALEYQMSRPGPAQQALAALVSTIADEPVLRETLDVFIDENRHRLRAARRLGVHANTVDNRLRKIAELTGLDPHRPRDMTRLEAAMAAAVLR